MSSPKLSICIATLNRAAYIGETLDSLTRQLTDAMELVIVDGASSDNTEEVVAQYQRRFENIRYFREATNSGVDADFDKAVGYARGDYCWLMTDDDLLAEGALQKVLEVLASSPTMVVVNADLQSADFTIKFSDGMLPVKQDKHYQGESSQQLFVDLAAYMSYIGCIITNREFWLSREREAYYGSLFIHVGVAFQSSPVNNVYVISSPLILIRYGNAMWTPRRFEIWMFMWPSLIWSFTSLSEPARQQVSAVSPWRSVKNMLLYKAMGGYGLTEYNKFIKPLTSGLNRLGYYLLAIAPAAAVSLFAIVACIAVGGRNTTELYDISLGPSTGPVGRWLAGKFLSAPS